MSTQTALFLWIQAMYNEEKGKGKKKVKLKDLFLKAQG